MNLYFIHSFLYELCQLVTILSRALFTSSLILQILIISLIFKNIFKTKIST